MNKIIYHLLQSKNYPNWWWNFRFWRNYYRNKNIYSTKNVIYKLYYWAFFERFKAESMVLQSNKYFPKTKLQQIEYEIMNQFLNYQHKEKLKNKYNFIPYYKKPFCFLFYIIKKYETAHSRR